MKRIALTAAVAGSHRIGKTIATELSTVHFLPPGGVTLDPEPAFVRNKPRHYMTRADLERENRAEMKRLRKQEKNRRG